MSHSVSTFKSTGCSKTPAGAALTLTLDRCDCTFSSPINRLLDLKIWIRLFANLLSNWTLLRLHLIFHIFHFSIAKHFFPFFSSKVREFVETNSGAMILLIVLGNDIKWFLELTKSKLPHLFCSIVLTILSRPINKSNLFLSKLFLQKVFIWPLIFWSILIIQDGRWCKSSDSRVPSQFH